MAKATLNEKRVDLSAGTVNMHRAINSLVEELEAIDWYTQRVDACDDPSLNKILQHNSNEEKEHAAMLVEWIRRNDDSFAKELKEYLFSDKEIAG